MAGVVLAVVTQMCQMDLSIWHLYAGIEKKPDLWVEGPEKSHDSGLLCYL